MNEQEAKEILENNSCYECAHGCDTGAVECKDNGCGVAFATSLAIKALEKQIPKKCLNYNKIAASGNCPCCMAFVDSYVAYCHSCGQRLEDEK